MKWSCIVFVTVYLLACSNNDETTITGRYINTYEPNAIHYVELKDDSTYMHFYKNNKTTKASKGNWNLITKAHKTEIMFSDWYSYGYDALDDCNGCTWFVKLKNGELIFNVDLPEEMNFKK